MDRLVWGAIEGAAKPLREVAVLNRVRGDALRGNRQRGKGKSAHDDETFQDSTARCLHEVPHGWSCDRIARSEVFERGRRHNRWLSEVSWRNGACVLPV